MEYGPMEILMAFVALGATIAIIALAAWGIHVWERRMNERGQQGSASGAVVGVLAILALVGLGIGGCAAYRSTERTVEATVEGKERVCSSVNSDNGTRQECKYLVFTDEGTFELTDSLIYGRFSSSDVYGRLDEDTTYTFKVAGWRFGLFSMYPNIVGDPEEVDP